MIQTDIFTNFFANFHFMPTHSVVINLKKAHKHGHLVQRIDAIEAERTYHSLMRSLVKKTISKSNYRRHKPKLDAVCSVEVSRDHRPHLHILVRKPPYLTEKIFKSLIIETASHNKYVAPTTYGVHITNLAILPESERDAKIHYNMKDIDKPNGAFVM